MKGIFRNEVGGRPHVFSLGVCPANTLIRQNKNYEGLYQKILSNSWTDPANFLHQLPQKESSIKLWGSRSRQLSASAPSKRIQPKIIWLQIPPTFCISSLKKNPAENYVAPDPANFLHQHPQKLKGSVAANSDITILSILAAI